MRQMRFVQGLCGVSLALCTLAAPSPVTADSAPVLDLSSAPRHQTTNGMSVPLIRDSGLTAVRYPESWSPQQVRSQAERDAEAFDYEVLYDRVGINQVIVRANEDTVRSAFRQRDGDAPIIRPVFLYNGSRSEETIIVPHEQVIVSFKPEQGIDARAAVAERFGLTVSQHLFGNTYVFDTNSGADKTPSLANAIAAEFDDQVNYAEMVFDLPKRLMWSTALPAGDAEVVPSERRGRDPLIDLQWHLANGGQGFNSSGVADADMDIPRFWNPNTRGTTLGDNRRGGYFGNQTTGRQVVVAVFDSGTDLQHENWRTNQNDPYNQTIRSTVIDSRLGRNFVTGNPLPEAGTDAHGTAVAGIITGARNNGVGTVGIAPSAQLYTVRVGGNDTGFISNGLLAQAIADAASVGSDVANHSYGGPISSQVEEEAFEVTSNAGRQGRGLMHFAASGNDGTNLEAPAVYPSVFSVGGVGPSNRLVDYASWSGTLDFVGPTQEGSPAGSFSSTAITTMDLSGFRGYDNPNPNDPLNAQGNYTFSFNGTSASSPMVAGVAALLLAERPTLTAYAGPNSLFDLMARTADRPEDPRRWYFSSNNNAGRFTWLVELPAPPPPEEDNGGENGGENGGDGDFRSDSSFGKVFRSFAQFVRQEPGQGDFREGGVFTTEQLGNPGGFRGSQGFFNDGFSFFHGYGRPNPMRAILNQPAINPYRDYRELSSDQHMIAGEVDAGEIVLAYQSDFTGDYLRLYASCLELLFPEEAPSSNEDFVAIQNCITSSPAPWIFNTVRATFPGEDPGPIEFHYMPSSADVFSSHDFEFGESVPIEDVLEGNVFPVVISTSRVPVNEFDPGDIGYNPRGRVLSGQSYGLTHVGPGGEGLPVPPETEGMELMVEVTIRYELNKFFHSIGNGGILRIPDGEYLQFTTGPNQYRVRGQSHNSAIPIPTAANAIATIDIPNSNLERIIPIWISNTPYFFEDEVPTPIYRTFRFPAGISNGSSVPFRIDYVQRAAPGNIFPPVSNPGDFVWRPFPSYPEWEFNDDGTFDQILEAPERGLRGYRLADVKVWATNPNPDPGTFFAGEDYFKPRATKPVDFGSRPVFTRAGNEIIYVDNSPFGIPAVLKAAKTDQFVRQPNPSNPELMDLVRHPQITLATACEGGPANSPNFPDCAQTLITSLDSDFKSNRLVYVSAFKAEGQQRVFTLTDDGFDERPLFTEMVDGAYPDSEAREAVFARTRDLIIFTDGVNIFMATEDGQDIATIFDGEADKFRNISGLTSRSNDFVVAFAAEREDSGFGLYYVLEGLNEPGSTQVFTEILNWPNSIEAQPVFSPDGTTLVFTSNTIDREAGTIPSAETPFRLYAIDNMDEVVFFGGAPSVRLLDLPRDTRGLPGSSGSSDQYIGALSPRFNAAGDRLAFVGYTVPGNFAAFGGFGEIATVPFGASDAPPATTPTPFVPDPTPVVPPDPTPTPEPTDGIVPAGLYTFDSAGDGWVFTRPEEFNAPRGQIVNGSLELESLENSNTFGYYRSPLRAIKLFDPQHILSDTTVDENGNVVARGPLHERLGSHYLVRYYLRRIGSDRTRIADMRVRVNNYRLQDYHARAMPSNGPNNLVPATDVASAYDLLFHPSPFAYQEALNDQYYFLNFDVFNILGANDANTGYILDRVEIFRVPMMEIEEIGRFAEYDFSTPDQSDDWMFMEYDFFDIQPMLGEVVDDALAISVPNPGWALGAWQTRAGTLSVDPTNIPGKLYVQMRMSLRADEINPFKVPEIRVDIGQADFNNITHSGLIGIGSGRFIPSAGNPRTITAYLEIPEGWEGPFDLVSMFELHSFESFTSEADRQAFESSPERVYLDRVEFNLIRVNNYPEVTPNP